MISIIVAVYNAEKFLKRAIDSILMQTYQDFEVILIDDGSTDASGYICDEYASKDNRVYVIHQENQGVGKVRQLGISLAKGTYSIHVDPDDWVEPNMLEDMLNIAERVKADVVISDFFYSGDDYEYRDRQSRFSSCSNSVLIQKIVAGEFHCAYWNKLIRHQLFDTVDFPKIDFCEDQLVVIQLLQKNSSFVFLDKTYYHYFQHPQSETNRVENNFIEKKLKPYHHLLKELVGKYDINLYTTSLYFFYSWMIDFKVDADLIDYLKPTDYHSLKNSYLSPGRIIKILDYLNAPFYEKFPMRIKQLFQKIKDKIKI